MKDNYLIVMAGFPGTGKSGVAKTLIDSLDDYELVSQNEIRRELGIKRMQKSQEETLRKADRAIAKMLNEGKGVIFDSVNRHTFRRQQLYGLASCCGKKVVTIECVCSEYEAKRRIKSRPQPDELISDPNDPRVYDKTFTFWEPVLIDFRYPGSGHVSYVTFDTEHCKLFRSYPRRVEEGMKPFIDKIQDILKRSYRGCKEEM